MGAPGRVVVINGASSAGKTTLAETFQEARAADGECWVIFGIDDFMPRLPRRWVAIDAWSGSLAADGVRLERGRAGGGTGRSRARPRPRPVRHRAPVPGVRPRARLDGHESRRPRGRARRVSRR